MSSPDSTDDPALPYRDTKPQGAADFYFAIDATFRFIQQQHGSQGLIRYWEDLGRSYKKPVWTRWREQGAAGIASYWQAFFAAEPGSEVAITREEGERVRLEVKRCPAIAHLREHGREILPNFCHHCYHISQAAASEAGYTLRLKGGNGRCEQTFAPAADSDAPQNFNDITPC